MQDRPWFVIFINPNDQITGAMKEPLDQLAMDYKGDIQFAYVIKAEEEFLSLSYWVYSVRSPRAYYLTKDGQAHLFDVKINRENIKEWIDTKEYLHSALTFATPMLFGDNWEKYIHYAIKDVR